MKDSLAAASAPDIRLIVVDMDGTLLDDDHNIPDTTWPLIRQLRKNNVHFVPASGRQFATLAHMFESEAEGMIFIAENGSNVMRDGQTLASTTMDDQTPRAIVEKVRTMADDGHDAGAVYGTAETAYIERSDDEFVTAAKRFYRSLTIVDDLLDVDADVLKVAVFDADGVHKHMDSVFADLAGTHKVVTSHRQWVDVMAAGVHKGVAVEQIQEYLGITRTQTMAFGDYHNDLEMLGAAEHSYAVANAHPDILAAARQQAPSNEDHGVITVVRDVLKLR